MPEVIRSFGYLIDQENVDHLEQTGLPPEQVLQLTQSAYPNHNAYTDPWTWLQWQGRQGACQGHSLAGVAQFCVTQYTGQQWRFSRAQAYYESQRIDGITGDRGSTLSAGQKLITQVGLCTEKDWPYPNGYNPRRPNGYEDFRKARMRASQPVKDAELAWDLLRAGAVIQTGVTWNNSFEPEICKTYRRGGGGGHSTRLEGLQEGTEYAWHHNSWQNWNGDGRNLWSIDFFKSILQNDRWAVFIAYQPTDLDIDPMPSLSEIEAM